MKPPPQPDDASDYLHFLSCWNEGRFFDAHEALEPRWIATRNPALRSLIQLAAALHHLQRRNVRGARILFTRALKALGTQMPPSCPFRVCELAVYAQDALRDLETEDPLVLMEARPRITASGATRGA